MPNGIRGVEGLHCSRVGGRPRGRIRYDAVPFVPNRRLGPRARRRRHDVHQAPAYGHPAARPGGTCPHLAWPRLCPRSPFKPTTIAAKMTSGHPATQASAASQASVCGRGEKATAHFCWHTAAKEREEFCDRVGTGWPARCMLRTLNASNATAVAIPKTAVQTKCWWKHRCLRRSRAGAWA